MHPSPQTIKNKQLILTTDASFTAAGYAIMIGDDPNQKLQSRKNNYAPIAFGSKTFNPTNLKTSIYAKQFPAIYSACSEFGHLMWGSAFLHIVFTDNRCVTHFCQTKIIPPTLWTASDYVLQDNFVIAHVAGAMNTVADFLSRVEINTTGKLEMNIRTDVTTQAIEVNIQSTGVAEEETLYLLPEEAPTEQQLWEEKNTFRNTAKTVTHIDPENEVSKLQCSHKPTAGTIDYREGHFKITQKFEENKTMTKF